MRRGTCLSLILADVRTARVCRSQTMQELGLEYAFKKI